MKFIEKLALFLIVCSVYTFAITPNEAWELDVVLDNFQNAYGDKNSQNSFGAAKGVIENGVGKAHLGGGYWYGTADAGSSVIGVDGESKIKSNINDAIDTVEKCMHVTMTTSTSDDEYPYATVGCTVLDEDQYSDVSGMTGLVVTAKGTGTVRINLITKDYLDANADWGFYGAEITLSAAKKTTTIPIADILPVPYSEGDPEPDVETPWDFATEGSKELNKVEIQVKDLEDADLYLYEIAFAGIKYKDLGWNIVSILSDRQQKTDKALFVVNKSQVAYSVNRAQHLAIDLFSAAGSHVSTLFSGNVGTGSHLVPINGNTGALSAGKYFVVLAGDNRYQVKPLSIVK